MWCHKVCRLILPSIFLIASSASADFVDPPGCPSTTRSLATVPLLAIPDNNSTGLISTHTVTGLSGFISDVDLSLNISHDVPSELDITLTSPQGTTIVITTDNGSGNDDVFQGSFIDDRAGLSNPPGPVTDVQYFNAVVESPIVPEQPLDAFYGENPNGTWTLTVKDDAANPGGIGILNSWIVYIRTCSIPPNTNTVNFAATLPTPLAITNGDATGVNSFAFPPSQGTHLCGVELFTNIQHTASTDLDIYLISPSGTEVTVSTDNGGSNDNVFAGTTWTNKAGNPVTDFVYSNGVSATPLSPEESFAVLYGQDPGGAWQLKVVDDAGGANTGSLVAWSLSLTTCSNGPDGDGDGFGDSIDNCPLESNALQSDFDSDGVGDICDGCSNDPNKSEPGDCGCSVPDINTDGDTQADCIDACPVDPNKTESGVCGCGVADLNSDGDTAFNCLEGCPNDPNKLNPGLCGCGVVDSNKDSNKNKIKDCLANAEMRAALKLLSGQLKKVKVPKSSSQISAQKVIAAKVKKLLKTINSLVAKPQGILSTNNGTNISAAVSSLSAATKSALKTGSKSFAKNKSAALSAIASLSASIPS